MSKQGYNKKIVGSEPIVTYIIFQLELFLFLIFISEKKKKKNLPKKTCQHQNQKSNMHMLKSGVILNNSGSENC